MENSVLARAHILGFDNLGFDTQRIIFNKARMFGWGGEEPHMLGTAKAENTLEVVIDFLIRQGVCFRKEKV